MTDGRAARLPSFSLTNAPLSAGTGPPLAPSAACRAHRLLSRGEYRGLRREMSRIGGAARGTSALEHDQAPAMRDELELAAPEHLVDAASHAREQLRIVVER